MEPEWIASLRDALEHDGAPLAVAFSGGVDSTALLHALAALPRARSRGLRALHVDHRLQADSHAWAKHCEQVCAALGLPCMVLVVEVGRSGSLEAAAREARYAALTAALQDDEVLVLAQHRDDRNETLLLRLMRGAGTAALTGMAAWRRHGEHRLWRPLLDVPRRELEAWVGSLAIPTIDDPSNADLRFSRNFVRHRLLPLLREHWPQADRSLAASAALLADDAELIDLLAARALAECRGVDPLTLRIAALRQQPAALQRHLLRRWFDEQGLALPPPTVLARVGPELLDAPVAATPSLHWAGGWLRRYRDLLHAGSPQPEPPTGWQRDWVGDEPLSLPPPFGRLELLGARGALSPLQVRPRHGGERMTLPGRPGQSLQHLLQQIGLPPWERQRLPLLFDAGDGELLAAGDLLLSARFERMLAAAGATLRWWPDPWQSIRQGLAEGAQAAGDADP